MLSGDRLKHFTNWALILHLIYILFPRFSNTFLLSIFVLIGSEIIRLFVIKDPTYIDVKTRKYKNPRNDILLHWIPFFLILLLSLYRNVSCKDMTNIYVVVIPLMFYFAYMNFDLRKILFFYQYPFACFEDYDKNR